MIICPYCNSKTPNLNYCVYCGSELNRVDSLDPSKSKISTNKFLLAIFTIFLLSLSSTVQIFLGLLISIFLPLSLEPDSELFTFFNLVIAIVSNISITIGIAFWFTKKTHSKISIKRRDFHIFNVLLLFIVSITLIDLVLSLSDFFFDILKLDPSIISPYDMFFGNDINLIVFSLLVIVIGPLFEETIYRFMIINLMKKQNNSFINLIIISSLIFTLSHTLNDILEASLRYILLHFIAIFILGSLLGYIFLKWGLAAAITFHSLWNLNSFITEILDSVTYQQLSNCLSLVFLLISFVIIVIFLKKRGKTIFKQNITFKLKIHEINFPTLNLLIIFSYQLFFPLIIYLIFGDILLSIVLTFFNPLSLLFSFILLQKEKSIVREIFSLEKIPVKD